MNLETELHYFWNWYRKEMGDFVSGDKILKAAYIDNLLDYPNWPDLNKAVDLEITKLNKQENEKSYELLVEACTIDEAFEDYLETCLGKLKPEFISKFIIKGCESELPMARSLFVKRLKTVNFPDSDKLMITIVQNDKNDVVRRMAFIELTEINKDLAETFVDEFLDSQDDYLRLVALQFLQAFKPDQITKLKPKLQNDPAALIRQELAKFKE